MPTPNGLICPVEKFREERYLKAFGDHLRSLRNSQGLSQEDLAGISNTALSQIGRIERGERAPTVLTILD
jgi:predicted transcriptional regulator